MRTRRRSIDAASRSELPLTGIIDASIEASFAGIRAGMCRREGLDALQRMQSMLSELAYDRARHRALACLDATHKARAVSLERAAQRMHSDDLDAAWNAALRGDTQVLERCLTPHLTPPPKRTPKGSPWRASGWLSRRSTGR